MEHTPWHDVAEDDDCLRVLADATGVMGLGCIIESLHRGEPDGVDLPIGVSENRFFEGHGGLHVESRYVAYKAISQKKNQVCTSRSKRFSRIFSSTERAWRISSFA